MGLPIVFPMLLVGLGAGLFLERLNWRQAAAWLLVAISVFDVFIFFGWNPVGASVIVGIMALVVLIVVFPDGIRLNRH